MYSIGKSPTTEVDIPENGFETLSNSFHQFKNIILKTYNCTGIEKLLTVNPGLLSLDVRPVFSSQRYPILGDILEILGLHCPLLQICQIRGSIKEVTDMEYAK